MPQLLLEIFSEEIPARMQERAREGLEKAMVEWLGAAGLQAEAVRSFAGPRRLVFVADGLPEKSVDVKEERKGPKVGAPEKAIEGFMRGAGLASIDQAEVRDDKKGQFYVAVIDKPGRKTIDVVADAVVEIVKDFHWPKSMRWGDGELRWVRPIQSILCVFDGKVVPFEIGGVSSGDSTEGHRVMGRGPFTVKDFDGYAKVLREEGCVILDAEERKASIMKQAKAVCSDAKLELVEDEGLLNEVAGLAEWPVVLLGEMDPAFLDLPPEVIKLSMRTHQKYFAVRDPKKDGLAPKFVVVANLEALDGGVKIAEGNARVLSARLNDARFFWDNDRKTPLEDNFEKLGQIVFHEKLGSVKDKAERVMALARELAPIVGADPDEAERAAKLAKCDLVSEMVFEFPELQGVMGRYYAELEGAPQPIADAIRDHYRPQGPSDDVPSDPVAVAVALADKLDTLVGFWAIDEKPTGSRDPFALRRAALGVIRIVLESDVRLRLVPLVDIALKQQIQSASKLGTTYWMSERTTGKVENAEPGEGYEILDYVLYRRETMQGGRFFVSSAIWNGPGIIAAARLGEVEGTIEREFSNLGLVPADLLSFFADRLKVHLREQGARHDLIDAVFALGEDDLVLIVKRVEALGAFLDTDDGANLLAGYKRAANILKAEEKKDGEAYSGDPDPGQFEQDEEKALHKALQSATAEASKALDAEDFAAAMGAMAKLRGPVDAFFDKVTVNADDAKVRRNRLLLLSQIRDALGKVADFSKIEG